MANQYDISTETFDMPTAVDVAAHRFAAELSALGYRDYVAVAAANGLVSSISLRVKGEPKSFFFVDGDWREAVKAGDAAC